MEQMRRHLTRALGGLRGVAMRPGVGSALRATVVAGLLAGGLPQVLMAPAPAAAAITLGYGMNGGEGKLDMVTGMGFGWMKILVAWKQYEPSRGAYSWADLDGRISRLRAKNLNILIRIDEIPDWASSRPGAKNAPPANDADLANFMGVLAARYKGRVAGYEIWNEPNLNYEWGNFDPDPVRYGAMLKAAYPSIKAADPAAVVVTGGLSPTGDGTSGPYLGDLYYLTKLADPNGDGDPSDGFTAYFDAIGSHPYGGPHPADISPEIGRNVVGTYFRRAEEQHDAILNTAKVDKPVWATEFGYFVDPATFGLNCSLPDHFNQLKVTPEFAGQQLVNAFQYAGKNWPWMGPMFVFGLDMSMDSWRPACEQTRFFSLLKADGNPLPAFTMLSAMPKMGAASAPTATPAPVSTATPAPASTPTAPATPVATPSANQPATLTPANNATLPGLGPTLSWTTPAGTTQVHLQVTPAKNDGPGLNLILDPSTSFAIPAPPVWYGMLPGMSYTWRVRTTTATTALGENDAAWGPWSATATFRTPAPSATAVTLLSPVNNTTVSGLTPTVAWASSDRSLFYYEIQLSKDRTFETDSAKATASVYQNLVHGPLANPANSYTIPASAPLEPRTMYYWRVRPRVQGDGTPVSWSAAGTFRTP